MNGNQVNGLVNSVKGGGGLGKEKRHMKILGK